MILRKTLQCILRDCIKCLRSYSRTVEKQNKWLSAIVLGIRPAVCIASVCLHTAGRMHRISLRMHTAGHMHSIGHYLFNC